jgi:small-conductance mechanosensitive channel
MSLAALLPEKPVDQIFAEMPLTVDGASAWLEANWSDVLIGLIWVGVALVAAIVLYFVLAFVRDRLVKFLDRGEGERAPWRSILATIVANTWRLSFVVLAAALAAAILGLSSEWLRAIVGATLIVQVGLWLGSFLREIVGQYAEQRTTDRSAVTNAMSVVRILINVGVWSVVTLVLLANLGIDITALVAGLGIGGIAIGLAAQTIFADLFASLSIILDRPFVRGDFIIFGDHMGTIERIGIKTTRVRSLSGEQIVISNANLLQATIRNYQLLRERRVVFAIGVVYRTPVDQVDAIPKIIREAIENTPKTRFDRSHFKEFGDSSLNFETVYYVLDADYGVFMDTQHAINLAIMREFEARTIDFAFPTRTVVLENAVQNTGVTVEPGEGAGARPAT